MSFYQSNLIRLLFEVLYGFCVRAGLTLNWVKAAEEVTIGLSTTVNKTIFTNCKWDIQITWQSRDCDYGDGSR